jgi:hypothetical protein
MRTAAGMCARLLASLVAQSTTRTFGSSPCSHIASRDPRALPAASRPSSRTSLGLPAVATMTRPRAPADARATGNRTRRSSSDRLAETEHAGPDRPSRPTLSPPRMVAPLAAGSGQEEHRIDMEPTRCTDWGSSVVSSFSSSSVAGSSDGCRRARPRVHETFVASGFSPCRPSQGGTAGALRGGPSAHGFRRPRTSGRSRRGDP